MLHIRNTHPTEDFVSPGDARDRQSAKVTELIALGRMSSDLLSTRHGTGTRRSETYQFRRLVGEPEDVDVRWTRSESLRNEVKQF